MSADCRRRRLLRLLGAGGVLGLGGCGGLTGGGEPTTTDRRRERTTRERRTTTAEQRTTTTERRKPTETTTEATPEETPERTTEQPSAELRPLEVLHAWSAGDGNEAMAALLDGFGEAHPEVELTGDVIDGVSGARLQQVVSNRLAADRPPSTFQNWPGAALERFDGELGDIGTNVWDSETEAAYRDGTRRHARTDDSYVAVPLNVHRVNNLFYNASVLESAGVDPAGLSSPADVVDACAAVAQGTDAVPFAHQTAAAWSTVQLWETALLAVAGAEGYRAFLDGEGDRSAVEAALEHVVALQEYFPPNAASIAFTQANRMVINGEAAFIQQGDWAAGAYRNQSFSYGADWGHVPYPGTEGQYAHAMDAFVYPADNPSPEATRRFLGYCASRDGQRRFNRPKSSIPPRTDVDVSDYSAFQREQYDAYRDATAQPPSVVHGLAVAPSVRTAVHDALARFVETYNVRRTADAVLDAVA